MFRGSLLIVALLALSSNLHGQNSGKPIPLTLRYQLESSESSGRFHRFTREQKWKPEETAIIVCDVWDLHHCLNAVRRLEQFAPRLNAVLSEARSQGVTIIHSPSDCMPAYEKHAARQRAINAPKAAWVPHEVGSWCSVIPTEERAAYPIDQSDGGEDDDPEEHAKWAAQLKAMGRNPGTPWKTQSKLITIDEDHDFISDRGDEVWNVLESRGIKNVILTGVHLNMCVLGRPFGLRQMARNGKNVVLMRDMTDVMYNPKRWPYVSHLTAIDLVVDHVERFICPTISSDQIIGGESFRFAEDHRPHLVIVMAGRSDPRQSIYGLSEFASKHLENNFRITTIFGSQKKNTIPGLAVLEYADVLLMSLHRRVLFDEERRLIQNFVDAGKPVIGIGSTINSFSLRKNDSSEGGTDGPEFDTQVFGGKCASVSPHRISGAKNRLDTELLHPILQTLSSDSSWQASPMNAWYRFKKLESATKVLVTGKSSLYKETQPVAWTFQRPDGGRSFYTSLGSNHDFSDRHFQQLLLNGVHWAVGLGQPLRIESPPFSRPAEKHWLTVTVPTRRRSDTPPAAQLGVVSWYRCVIRIPEDWDGEELTLNTDEDARIHGVFVNGKEVSYAKGKATIPKQAVVIGDANLLTVGVPGYAGLVPSPTLVSQGRWTLPLHGKWQHRLSNNGEDFSNMPLPAKFGGSSDIVYKVTEPLFVARPLTLSGEFTQGIEGPACNADGDIFAVNFCQQGTIGRVRENGVGDIFVTLPDGSTGNGIRFGRDGTMFVADYTGHNILQVNPETRKVSTLAHNPNMNQPNDLAISPDGTLWASDPNWKESTGQVWRIDADGTVTLVAPDMGTTNGIEVSPDGKTLYVNESAQRNIWAFTISDDKSLTDKRLFKKFDDHGFDGQRCDADGNLYVTRYGKGTVVKLSPKGEILQEINVLGSRPSNLCFGGPGGKTVYVTEVEHTRLVKFRVDEPGVSWTRQ